VLPVFQPIHPIKHRFPIRLPSVCRWFTQGVCANGDDCANLHENALPPDVVPRDDLVNILVGMGWDKSLVIYTLKRCRNHLPTTTTILLTEFQRIQEEFNNFKGEM